MLLTFNLRHLEQRDLHLEGELSPEGLELKAIDELVDISGPVQYDLTAERLSQSVLVRGRLSCTLTCHCARCLKAFTQELEMDDWTCDLPLEGEDKVPVENDSVDLTPYIREDILLAFPQHPLCEQDCRGMLPPDNNLSKTASVNEQESGSSAAWAALNKLKF
jgi:uncharacterized protein